MGEILKFLLVTPNFFADPMGKSFKIKLVTCSAHIGPPVANRFTRVDYLHFFAQYYVCILCYSIQYVHTKPSLFSLLSL